MQDIFKHHIFAEDLYWAKARFIIFILYPDLKDGAINKVKCKGLSPLI